MSKSLRNYQVVWRDGAWAVKKAGARRCILKGMTQRIAWYEAKRRARADRVSAYLHRKDGMVVTRTDFDLCEDREDS